jgi:hypothetical protein
MGNKLIVALLASITAGAASAQVAGSFGGDTNAFLSNPAPVEVAALDGNVTNMFQAAPGIYETGPFGQGPIIGEPLGLGSRPLLSDSMVLDGEGDWSLADPGTIRLQGDVLSKKFDLLRGDPRGAPVYFGRDKEVKFVESHDNRPGVPVPVGISYPLREQRLEFFGEIAPILDFAPVSSLGWGGGVGIRFYLGR